MYFIVKKNMPIIVKKTQPLWSKNHNPLESKKLAVNMHFCIYQ